jgi:hypothetical protein
MIPEEEYGALLKLFSGGDHLKVEKEMTDAKMSRVIRNPKFTELEKGKKYDLLYKKRRQLKKMIEDQPQKVVIDSESTQLPTTGVVPAQVPQTNLQQIQQNAIRGTRATKVRRPIKINQKRKIVNQPVEDEWLDADDTVPEDQPIDENVPTASNKSSSSSIRSNIINQKYLSPLKKLVNKNRDKLGIREDGKIFRNLKDKNPVKDSDIESALSYLAGGKATPSPGILYIYQRLSKEPEFREMVEKSGKAKINPPRNQKGTGKKGSLSDSKKLKSLMTKKVGKNKKYIIEKINLTQKHTDKTKGLTRVNKFKPKLWVKLGV